MIENKELEATQMGGLRSLWALERARRVRDGLAEAARQARRSRRGRRNYDTGAFARRRGARILAYLVRATFMALFVLPSVGAALYYGFFASPQYVSEFKFTVHGGAMLSLDGVGLISGLPSGSAVQDTQVLTNYIQSRAMVEVLQDKLDLRQRFGSDKVDWIERFDRDDPIERLVRYWKSMTDVSIELPGGIVTFRVRAFRPGDAKAISDEVLKQSEMVINDINRRMWQDNISSAQREFERAGIRLNHARQQLERVRNSEGILDAGLTGKALTDLLTVLRGDQLKLLQEYEGQLKSVNADAPQMRALKERITAIANQIRDFEAKMTGSAAEERRLSGAMRKFADLELEQKIAEKQYASTAAALELARATAERRLVYLQAPLKPGLPEEARYPKRLLYTVVVACVAFLSWALLMGLITMARNHMA
jgi:capsular polysaccharide transport system permease protein